MEFWDSIKGIMQVVVIPALAGFAYFIRKYFSRVEQVEIDIATLKTRQAVLESQVSDIRQDIHDIKKGVEKLLDRIHG